MPLRPILLCLLLLLTVVPQATHAQRAKERREQSQTNIRADTATVNFLRTRGITFSHDNAITLFNNGQAKFDDLFAAVAQATSSIHMEYFNFRNDSIAMLLFDLLAVKVQQGVEVRLLYDAFGNSSNNQPLKKEHLTMLRSRGLEIYEYDPIKFPWVNHVFSRDHRKIVVIDGSIAYTGGMNVADYYITGTEQVGEWRDMHCRIEGTEVNTLQRIFVEIWYDVTKELLTDAKYFRGGTAAALPFSHLAVDSCATAGEKMIGIINREPRRTPKIIREFYIDAINNAQEDIRIINPYFTLSHRLKKAMKRAVARGVRVEIMLSVASDIPLTPDCGFYNAHKLMKSGCDIWLSERGFHHTKIMTVDGQFCTVGSANLNARSLRFDYEENAVVVDSCTTTLLSDYFEAEKSTSFYLTPESWNAFRTRWQKFRGWFAHLLAPWL